jgi:transposase
LGTTRKKFSKEYKEAAVKLTTEQGLSVAQAARDLGIGENMLHRWRRELADHGAKAFRGNGVPIEEELARLRRENQVLKEEREILKKATIFFAQHYPEKK